MYLVMKPCPLLRIWEVELKRQLRRLRPHSTCSNILSVAIQHGNAAAVLRTLPRIPRTTLGIVVTYF